MLISKKSIRKKLTANDIQRGFFEVEDDIYMPFADSSELIPLNGIQQIYEIDYTITKVSKDKFRVNFSSSVTDNPPSRGIANLLKEGDEIYLAYFCRKK